MASEEANDLLILVSEFHGEVKNLLHFQEILLYCK